MLLKIASEKVESSIYGFLKISLRRARTGYWRVEHHANDEVILPPVLPMRSEQMEDAD